MRYTVFMFLWFKALHLIFMVTWFAGLLYLPRLFIYHAMSDDETGIARFKIMERKLFWGIATPGAVLTLAFGFAMLAPEWEAYRSQWWMHAKLGLVGLLATYHAWCAVLLRDFKRNANRHSHVWYRWFNEVPVLMLAGIVLLAVFRPA